MIVNDYLICFTVARNHFLVDTENMLKRVTAFSPGHVTGLFYMQDKSEDPLYAGSLGAGFSLKKGVYTTVEMEDEKENCKILINGEEDRAPVSRQVVQLFFKETGITPGSINISHLIETPQGSGFGSSGAGALSLVLALNHLYGDPLSFIESAKIAHVAEVICKTGLGTVMGETIGGFKILIKVGAPGIGETLSIAYPHHLCAVFVVFGLISTKDSLSDPELRRSILKAGKEYHGLIKNDPVFDFFLECSRNFTEKIGLATPNVRAVLDYFDSYKINASMLMFGEGTFSIVSEEKSAETIAVAERFCKTYTGGAGRVFVSNIAEGGAEIVSENQYT